MRQHRLTRPDGESGFAGAGHGTAVFAFQFPELAGPLLIGADHTVEPFLFQLRCHAKAARVNLREHLLPDKVPIRLRAVFGNQQPLLGKTGKAPELEDDQKQEEYLDTSSH